MRELGFVSGGIAFKFLDEQAPDDLALGLGIGDAGELAEEQGLGMEHLDMAQSQLF